MAAGIKVPLSGDTDTFNIAGVDLHAAYTIFALHELVKFYMYQSSLFRAQQMTTTLHFPQPVQYTIRDRATGAAVSSGTSDTVNVTVGDDVEFVAPNLDPAVGGSVLPTFALTKNTYSNMSSVNYYRQINQKADEIGFHIPSVTVFPATPVTDAVKLDSFDYHYGPKAQNQIVLPLEDAGRFKSSAAPLSWQLGGFGAVAGDPALLDPEPTGTGAFVAPATARQYQGARFEAAQAPWTGGPDLFYEWDFGDGSTLTTANSPAKSNRVVQHVYRSSGSYDVTLTVTEAQPPGEDPRTWTSTRTVVVDAAPPQLSGVDYDAGGGAVPLAADAALVDAQVTGLGVTFSEPMNDPPGDAQAGDVTSPASYLLVRSPDETTDPLSCTPMGSSCATSDQMQVAFTCDPGELDFCGVGHLDGSFGQSFTAGRSGSLAGIAVYLDRFDNGTSYTLRVYDGGIAGSTPDTYAPAGALLREQPVTLTAGRNLLVLANPLPVVAGHVYTFTIVGGSIFAPDAANNGYTYPGGQALFEAGHDLLFETWVTLPGAQAPFGQLDGGTQVSVDAVAYDGATGRASLSVNGGNPLPNGHYRLIVRAAGGPTDIAGNVLDGDGDGTIGGDFVRDFSLSSAAPRVGGVGSSAIGNIAEGARTHDPIADLEVAFNEPVNDPAGNTDIHDVTNPANYALIGAGANGVFDAKPCVTAGSLCLAVDQEVLTTADGSDRADDGFFGQYFHARRDGDIAAVTFKIDASDASTGTFALYAGNWNGPTLPASPLRSQSITLQPGWNTVTLATPLTTAAGQDYFFIVTGAGEITAPWKSISLDTGVDHRVVYNGAFSFLYSILDTPTTTVPGLASLGDDVAIPIDAVAYDAATHHGVARAQRWHRAAVRPVPPDRARLERHHRHVRHGARRRRRRRARRRLHALVRRLRPERGPAVRHVRDGGRSRRRRRADRHLAATDHEHRCALQQAAPGRIR